jgi:hypothetical protein
MATADQVITAALQRILVRASESPLEADEYQDAIFALNNYMLDLDANGINLGYTEIDSLGDQITIPTGALRGTIANLAIELAPDYSGVVSEALVKAAREGEQTMRKLGQRSVTSRYPSTLPRGSGNYDYSYVSNRFYPDEEAQILAETTGAIGLETDTNTAAS